VLLVGWVDEQIEGWRVMLERNVSAEFNRLVNSTLMFVNLNSQRKTKFSRSMSFLGINRGRPNPREERKGPAKVIKRERVQAVDVEEGGVEAVEAADVVGEGEAGTPVTELPRTRTKLQGAITIGNEVMTRKWRGGGPPPA
jgi:hypothetical protein